MTAVIRTLLLMIVLALTTRAAAAQDLKPLLILRLEGVVQPTLEAARNTDGFAVVSLGFLGDSATARRWLGLEDARTIGPDDRLDGKDVLAVVAPFQPNLLVAGSADIVAELRDAPSGTALTIEGLVDGDSRVYYLRSVTRGRGVRG